MPTKKKILKKIEKQVVYQEREKAELEDSEEITRKRLDASIAPALDVNEELQKEWKHEETERELQEQDVVEEDKDIEDQEEKGENPYPEIEEAIKEEADEEDEEEEE